MGEVGLRVDLELEYCFAESILMIVYKAQFVKMIDGGRMDCEDDYILQGDRFRVVEWMFGGKLDLLLKSMESEKSTDIWADMCQNHWH